MTSLLKRTPLLLFALALMLAAAAVTPGAQAQSSCPAGRAVCGGQCVDLSADARNCGACGERCDSSSQCLYGTCQPTAQQACRGGTTSCNGECVSLFNDPFNCGQCGNRCQANWNCVGGACRPPPTR